MAKEYIYIEGWDKFQHYQDGRRMTWVKCYTELLHKDEYLDLAATDRALLHGVWIATGQLGNGRVPADQRSLRARLRLKCVNLERLIQAGFLTVSSRDLVRDPTERLEQKRVEETRVEENLDLSRNRRSKPDGTVEEDQPEKTLPKALARILDAAVVDELTSEQCALVSRAWFHGTELRHSLASVESAESPVAMLVAISRRIVGKASAA